MSKYALVVGISEYQDLEISDLLFAGRDAEALGECLEDDCGFDEVTVLTTKGDSGPVTSGLIARELGRIADDIEPEDTFIFYFSGHGVEREGDSILLTSDTAVRLPELALPIESLRKALAGVECGQQVLIFDCCRNDPVRGKGDGGNLLTKGFARDIEAIGKSASAGAATTCLMFSCSEDERAYEWPTKQHGVFTHFLLEGLREKGWRGDQLILQEVETHVKAGVERWSKKRSHRQTPWSEMYGSIGPVILAERTAEDEASAKKIARRKEAKQKAPAEDVGEPGEVSDAALQDWMLMGQEEPWSENREKRTGAGMEALLAYRRAVKDKDDGLNTVGALVEDIKSGLREVVHGARKERVQQLGPFDEWLHEKHPRYPTRPNTLLVLGIGSVLLCVLGGIFLEAAPFQTQADTLDGRGLIGLVVIFWAWWRLKKQALWSEYLGVPLRPEDKWSWRGWIARHHPFLLYQVIARVRGNDLMVGRSLTHPNIRYEEALRSGTVSVSCDDEKAARHVKHTFNTPNERSKYCDYPLAEKEVRGIRAQWGEDLYARDASLSNRENICDWIDLGVYWLILVPLNLIWVFHSRFRKLKAQYLQYYLPPETVLSRREWLSLYHPFLPASFGGLIGLNLLITLLIFIPGSALIAVYLPEPSLLGAFIVISMKLLVVLLLYAFLYSRCCRANTQYLEYAEEPKGSVSWEEWESLHQRFWPQSPGSWVWSFLYLYLISGSIALAAANDKNMFEFWLIPVGLVFFVWGMGGFFISLRKQRRGYVRHLFSISKSQGGGTGGYRQLNAETARLLTKAYEKALAPYKSALHEGDDKSHPKLRKLADRGHVLTEEAFAALSPGMKFIVQHSGYGKKGIGRRVVEFFAKRSVDVDGFLQRVDNRLHRLKKKWVGDSAK